MNAPLRHTLLALEQRLLDPAIRKQRAAVAALLAPEFREFGRSGRAYTRNAILDLLEADSLDAEGQEPIGTFDFEVAPLGDAAALATYRSVHAGVEARRSSVWVWREGRTPIP